MIHALGNLISIVFKFLAKVEAIIKKISSKKTISVIEDILNSGFILFLPLNLIILQVHLINLKSQESMIPFDKQLY